MPMIVQAATLNVADAVRNTVPCHAGEAQLGHLAAHSTQSMIDIVKSPAADTLSAPDWPPGVDSPIAPTRLRPIGRRRSSCRDRPACTQTSEVARQAPGIDPVASADRSALVSGGIRAG